MVADMTTHGSDVADDFAGAELIAAPESVVSDSQLSGIDSWDDAISLVNDVFGGAVVEADKEIGIGFAVLSKAQKHSLIGVPMMILKGEQYKTEKGSKGIFTSLYIVTKDGRKLIVNDGGSGIHEQVTELWTRKPEKRRHPILVRNGLRVSTYDHEVYGPSETFYLDTSATA